MPGSRDATPPGWNESDSLRETLLILVDDRADRDALRQAGRVLFDLAIETTRGEAFGRHSPILTELRAALADLRHLQGYLAAIGREPETSSLSAEDEGLAHFATRQALALAAVADRIAKRLSAVNHPSQSRLPTVSG